MQNNIKGLVLSAVVLIGLYLVVCLAVYRIPAGGEPEYVSGRVIYKLNDNTGTNRQFFEETVMGNRLVRLEDDSVWYVSDSDYQVLWPRDPYEMRKMGQTLRTQLKVKQLLFGGYIVEEIRELDILKEAPTIIE